MKNIIARRKFIKLVGAGGAGLLTGSLFPSNKLRSKPNIIVIVADDMGYNDIGVYGCKDIPTPGIDSIAENGVRFKNAYVSSPLCSPTRAGLMTGRYQQRFGYEFNPGPPPGSLREQVGLPAEETTLAEKLKSAGYVTGVVGKWHLGMRKKYHPLNRGFDSFFGFLHGGHKYFDDPGSDNPILRDHTIVREKEYLTNALTRESISFIDRAKGKPFFLYLAYNAGHTPLQATRKYLDRFLHIKDKKRRTYGAMISAMDDGIKSIINKLEKKGIIEDTIIFFLNDNGGSPRDNGSINYPLRGGKGSLHEGGIRVPYLMQWKGRLPKNIIFDSMVSSLDIFTTAVIAAGGALPENKKIDGVNLLPFLVKGKGGEPHKELFWRSGRRGQNFAVRKGKWKLLLYGRKPPALYNISEDINERNNLAEKNPEIVSELKALIVQWKSELREPLWKIPRIRKNRKTKK
ncbi:MAG: sulfatase [Acidobacteriota bacterium]